MSALEALAAELRAEGGLIGAATRAPGEPAAQAPAALAVEAVREGHALHYGSGRVVATEDPDLALLAGDRLYALGLERLAAAGDLDTIAELADLISVCARAAAEGRPGDAERAWSGVARRHGLDVASGH